MKKIMKIIKKIIKAYTPYGLIILYKKYINFVKTITPWQLKQFFGLKYKNTDFCFYKNFWLYDQLWNCPYPEAYLNPVCWKNLKEFCFSLRIKNAEEKIFRRMADFSLSPPPPPQLIHKEFHTVIMKNIIICDHH